MDMREIQVFRAVMQAGTTSKAANLLGVSQPAISQAIRKLEDSSGLRLFERVRGRLVPTPEAGALMEEVDRCFAGFELIEHRIRSLKSFGVGRLAIGSLPALGTGFMPRAIAAFGLEKRRLQMSFQIMSSREVLQQVAAGQLDFGLMADELSVAGMEHSVFLRTPGVIAMHSRHPLAGKPVLHAADLVQHAFIALNPEDASRRRLEGALREQGLALNPILETPYSNSVCELALNGLGMGMVHPIMALDYLSRGLTIKRIGLDISFTSLLVFRPGAPLSGNAKSLLKAMRIQLDSDMHKVGMALGAPAALPL
ncbi:LysR substrate-binding domain-containing protein [Bordetella petrii]|uniref:LysR substrate-binding domain-containing protein n=1 Tax=Bordetella petrii TaxID=94624 RepID=UPI001E3E9256|nr:LysR substrate-binding domain-containing protein [Bordetella petrii]MCD0503171.1 LysR substrate-binding domain-containing protein [Bordetella petrii]